MKLSELIYECVKVSTGYGDPSFTYKSFITQEAKFNPDYSSSIVRVFPDVNSFFQRLSTLGKIERKVVEINEVDAREGKADLRKDYGIRFKEITSVFQIRDVGSYNVIPFLTMAGKVSFDPRRVHRPRPLYVQYRPSIKTITEADIPYITPLAENENGIPMGYSYKGKVHDTYESALAEAQKDDIDTEDLGIIPEAIPLCEQWCKAFANEMDGSYSHALMVETESRILDLKTGETVFSQQRFTR